MGHSDTKFFVQDRTRGAVPRFSIDLLFLGVNEAQGLKFGISNVAPMLPNVSRSLRSAFHLARVAFYHTSLLSAVISQVYLSILIAFSGLRGAFSYAPF